MPTECSAETFEFREASGRVVVAGFDGGAITSDAGAPLRANDDETRTPREITLEGVEGLHRSCP
jgi:hypothetical protein